MRRFLNLEDKFSLSRAAVIIGVLTLLSRVVGLMRDRLFASHFGAGDTLDIYYAAFRIPDFIFNLLVLGTLSVAFIPVFTEWLIKDQKRAYKIANTILNFSFLAMLALCLMLTLLAKPLTHLLVPGFNGWKFEQTLLLTKIFLWSPVIFTVSNVFGSILNSQKRFFMANLAPILYNLGIIFGLIYLYPRFGLTGLGLGVILGALLHLGVQAIEAFRHGFTWQPALELTDDSVKKIGKLFVPRIFGLDPSQISLLIGSVIGSLLVSGTITVLNLANNLQAVPIGIFAISIAVAAFPLLSEQFARRQHEDFAQTLAKTMNQILFFIIPISILMLLFRAYLVRLVYGAGKFNWENTIATFNTLGIFAVSLFAQALVPLFSRAFYARHNTKTPVLVGLISMAINITLSYWLATNQLVFGVRALGASLMAQTSGVEGIALGFSLASIFNCLVLFILLRHSLAKEFGKDQRPILEFDGALASGISRIVAASIIMGLAGYVAIYAIAPFVNTRTVLGILLQSAWGVGLATVVYLAAADRLNLPQTKAAIAFFKKMFRLS
ncbi:MAG: murein biosynthesis integral membrane protein MurJ [Patescibacteria group bacterium]|nr:murein biosynthesis integral membrane protein MurJ [Patescibacteria group bacterium]